MNPKLKEKLLESLMAVLPITLIVLALSVALVPMDVGTAVMFTVGAVLLVFGMGLFQLGAEMAMTPLGEGIGVQMERVKKIPVIVAIAFERPRHCGRLSPGHARQQHGSRVFC